MSIDFCIKRAEPIHLQIAQAFRGKIMRGELKANACLPTTTRLVRQLSVSRMVIHKAMQHLVADGLIVRKRGAGTYVSSRRARAFIGVLFGPSLLEEAAYFPRAVLKFIQSEINAMADKRWTCRIYDGLSDLKKNGDKADSEAYQDFIRDIKYRSAKGFILILGESKMNNALSDLAVPIVKLGPSGGDRRPDVILDFHRFAYDSVKFIARQGRTKICYFRTNEWVARPSDLDGLQEAARDFGLPPVAVQQLFWFSGSDLEQTAYAKTLRLLAHWQANKSNAPDALLVSDDIAARGITRALISKGSQRAARWLVISMTNEGIMHPYGMPVVRYEISPKSVAQALIRVLWERIATNPETSLPVRIAGKFRKN